MKREVHEWRARDPDGSLRYFHAALTWKGWVFKTTLKSEPDWHPIESPGRALYEDLRRVLWNKYQRGRLPWKRIEELDRILEGLPAAETEALVEESPAEPDGLEDAAMTGGEKAGNSGKNGKGKGGKRGRQEA